MTERQSRVQQRAKQIIVFLRAYKAKLGLDRRIAQMLARIVTAEAALAKLAGSQIAVVTVTPRRIRNVRDTLRTEHMIPISRAAKDIFRDEPALLKAVRVPHKAASVAELHSAAVAMAKAVTPHRKAFIDGGFAKDFLVPLRTLAAELKQWSQASESTATKRSHLTREIRTTCKELSRLFPILDSYVRLAIRDEASRAEWGVANRLGKRKGRPTKRRLAAQRARQAHVAYGREEPT